MDDNINLRHPFQQMVNRTLLLRHHFRTVTSILIVHYFPLQIPFDSPCPIRDLSQFFLRHVMDCRLLAYSGFPFPIALTMWHMVFCSSIGFLCVRVFGIVKSHNMPSRDYLRKVMPIGMLYAASLWLSNSSYLYLSVSFIQMTKSLMPGLVYTSGIFMGIEVRMIFRDCTVIS
jgi:hypothetical protein